MDPLAPLERQGPFATVYVAAPEATEAVDDVARIEAKHIAQTLEGEGAPASVIEQVVDALPATVGQDAGVCVVVDPESMVLSWPLSSPPASTLVRYGPLPSLVPLLEARRAEPPHLVVLIDRLGADLGLVLQGRLQQVDEVEGETLHVQRSAPGGWSQRRFQQRAENAWEHNATQVADEVARLARRHGVRCVLVAGDERAANLFERHLPDEIRDIVTRLDGGGRAEDGSDDELAVQLSRTVATVVAGDIATLLQTFAERRDGDETAVDGIAETVLALSQALVEALLVHDDPADDRTVAVALGAPPLVVATPDELRQLGQEPVTVRLTDGLVWAAYHGGADIHPVPAHGLAAPRGGVGALLRSPRSALASR
jgi:hypothetical protein